MDLELHARGTSLPREDPRLGRGEPAARTSATRCTTRLRLTRDDHAALGQDPRQEGLARLGLAEGVRRPGLERDPAATCSRKRRALAGAPRVVPVRPGDGGAGDHGLRHARAAEALPARHRQRRSLVEPGLQRARLGLRPRVAEDQGRARSGDNYIVNGQKTWTTLGQYGDWIFCLVRTSTEGKPQTGISFLLIDMKIARRHGAADHHARRRARGQRGLVRQRRGAGRRT
mgnify:CR=1 FL=1